VSEYLEKITELLGRIESEQAEAIASATDAVAANAAAAQSVAVQYVMPSLPFRH